MDEKEKLDLLVAILKLYLARPSSDGAPIRQQLRKELQDIINS